MVGAIPSTAFAATVVTNALIAAEVSVTSSSPAVVYASCNWPPVYPVIVIVWVVEPLEISCTELIDGVTAPPLIIQLFAVDVDGVFTGSEYVTVIVVGFVRTIEDMVGAIASTTFAATVVAKALRADDVSVASCEPAVVYASCNWPPVYPVIVIVWVVEPPEMSCTELIDGVTAPPLIIQLFAVDVDGVFTASE